MYLAGEGKRRGRGEGTLRERLAVRGAGQGTCNSMPGNVRRHRRYCVTPTRYMEEHVDRPQRVAQKGNPCDRRHFPPTVTTGSESKFDFVAICSYVLSSSCLVRELARLCYRNASRDVTLPSPRLVRTVLRVRRVRLKPGSRYDPSCLFCCN